MKKAAKPIPLGRRLIETGVITEAQLDLALKLQQRTGEILGEILIKLGFISQEVLSSTLAAQSNVSHIDLSKVFIEPEVITLIPESFARKHKLIPVMLENNNLTVALENIFNVEVIGELERMSGYFINVVAATENDIVSSQDIHYSGGFTLDELIEESINLATGFEGKRQEAMVEEAPIVKLVNQFIIKGIKENATDIHIEPEETVLRIRYRIDGLMVLGPSIPKSLQNPIIARIKIISGANIAETRLPQDGRTKFQLGRRQIDIRVSIFPTINGENVVLRLLDKSKLVLGLDRLGMEEKAVNSFKKAIERPFGMILVTGPTGSGKTTTLYSALAYLNNLEKTIITLEDPVEYEFPIIRQAQVNPKIDFTFAEGLKTILRQDPDIILVGEMRDKETIDMAIRSALTGHLVLSTIHTNNSTATIGRLLDMGVEPFLIASTVIQIIAQRLLRKICENCRRPLAPEEITLPIGSFFPAGAPLPTFYRGAGCEQCNNTGCRGRIGVYEVLEISAAIRDLIEKEAPSSALAEQAAREGFKTLFACGLEKAVAGVIPIEEAFRVSIGVS